MRVQRVQKVQRVQRGRLTGLRPEGCGRLSAAGYVRFAQGATALRAEGCGIAPWAMSIKSALRDWLSMSYSMKSILLIGSLRSPPYPASPDFPLFRGQNKTPQNTLFISGSTVSTGYCATSKRGKGGGASHQRGIAFPRPHGGCMVFPRAKARL